MNPSTDLSSIFMPIPDVDRKIGNKVNRVYADHLRLIATMTYD